MSKIDLVSFWYSSGNIGMAPYVNTSADGGHIDYEGVYSKVDLNTRIQSIISTLPDLFESYTIKLTDVNLSGILVSKAECVLKASSSSASPDYTQILTNINTNLTNLNSKFSNSNGNIPYILERIFNTLCGSDVTLDPQTVRSNSYISSIKNSLTNIDSNLIYDNRNVAQQLELLFRCFNNSEPSSNANGLKVGSLFASLIFTLSGVGRNNITNNSELSDQSMLRAISRLLRQSISPYASITDVLSALNTTIDSKQDTTIVNNEVTPLAEINIDVPFEVKNLKKSDVENL